MTSECKCAVSFALILQSHERLIYNLYCCLCVWECLCACVIVRAVACLRGGSFFFWHVSCAVKAYCVWVITCHRKPWALLTPQSCHCCCVSIALPLFLSNPCQPSLSPCVFSPSIFLIFSSLWVCVSSQKGDIRVLKLVSLIFLFYVFFHLIFPEGIQPQNNQCRSSCNSCQRWLLDSFVIHVTTRSRGYVDHDRSAGSLPLCGPIPVTAWKTTWWSFSVHMGH